MREQRLLKLAEFVDGEFRVMKDSRQQADADGLSLVYGHHRATSVRVLEKVVAALYSDYAEAGLMKRSDYRLAGDSRGADHWPTAIR